MCANESMCVNENMCVHEYIPGYDVEPCSGTSVGFPVT